MYKTYE